EALAKLAKSSGDQSGGGEGAESPLAKALRSGDLAAAAEAARDLIGAKADPTPEERAKTGRELEQILKDMEAAEKATKDAQSAPTERFPEEPDGAQKGAPSPADAAQTPSGIKGSESRPA